MHSIFFILKYILYLAKNLLCQNDAIFMIFILYIVHCVRLWKFLLIDPEKLKMKIMYLANTECLSLLVVLIRQQ